MFGVFGLGFRVEDFGVSGGSVGGGGYVVGTNA